MRTTFFSLLIVSVSGLYACTESHTQHEHATDSSALTDHSHHHAPQAASLGSPELDTLHKQVIAVHDSAMARMGELAALQEQAHQQSVSLKPTETARKKELTALLNELNTADEAMLQWMQQFDSQMKTKTDSTKLVYLQTERIKIDLVYQQIMNSIQHAQHVLHTSTPN